MSLQNRDIPSLVSSPAYRTTSRSVGEQAPAEPLHSLLSWPERLSDPETGRSLSDRGASLETVIGTRYPVIDGIADFLADDHDEVDGYTQANIEYYEALDRRRYELMWSQYVDRHAYRRIRRIIEEAAGVPLRPGTVYLDAGCGFGYFVLNLLEAPEIVEHHAIDVHRQGLRGTLEWAQCAGRRIQAVRGTLYRLPYRSNTFHLITGNGVLHHLGQPAQATEQIADRLAPDGYGVFVEPTSLWERAHLRNPFLRQSWRRLRRTGRLGTGQTASACEPTPHDMNQWVSAFQDAGLEVRVVRFHFIAGFLRCWIVSELMARPRYWWLGPVCYAGVRAAEFLDRCLCKGGRHGFYDLVVVHKAAAGGEER